VVLILTYFFLLFGFGVEIVLFLVRLSFIDGTHFLNNISMAPQLVLYLNISYSRVYISYSWLNISYSWMYTKNQLPKLYGSALKVPGRWWGG
jgi:hypothetical protein